MWGHDATAYLQGIIRPLAWEIAEARVATEGIALVVHKPGKVAKQALKQQGLPATEGVWGLTCGQAVAALGTDLQTREWLADPPKEGQTKIYLVVDDGTLLVTLTRGEDGVVYIDWVPDIYLVN